MSTSKFMQNLKLKSSKDLRTVTSDIDTCIQPASDDILIQKRGLDTVRELNIVRERLNTTAIQGLPLEDKKHLAKTLSPDLKSERLAAIRLKAFLKNETVRTFADLHLATALQDKGVTVDWCIQQRLEILSEARAAKQLGNALRAVEGLEQFLGMHVKQTESKGFTETVTTDELAETLKELRESKQVQEVTS